MVRGRGGSVRLRECETGLTWDVSGFFGLSLGFWLLRCLCLLGGSWGQMEDGRWIGAVPSTRVVVLGV
jgi:hypothetical protein